MVFSGQFTAGTPCLADLTRGDTDSDKPIQTAARLTWQSDPSRAPFKHPKTNTMKPPNALFQLLLLTLAASASGQSLPMAPQAQSVRSLNLTLSKTAAPETPPAAFGGGGAEAVPAQGLTGPVSGRALEAEPGAGRLPYGAGFESRQQGSVSGGGGRGAGGQGGRGRGR
jgi:hypothetical protein